MKTPQMCVVSVLTGDIVGTPSADLVEKAYEGSPQGLSRASLPVGGGDWIFDADGILVFVVEVAVGDRKPRYRSC